MIRTLLLAATAACLCAQVSAPLIGYVRDRAGAVRPVYGVAGAFVLGDAVEHSASGARFSGASGCIVRDDRVLRLRDGRTVEVGEGGCVEERLPVAIEGDEVVIETTGARLRTGGLVDEVEQFGAEWYVLRAADRLYALRATQGREAIFELPEAGS